MVSSYEYKVKLVDINHQHTLSQGMGKDLLKDDLNPS